MKFHRFFIELTVVSYFVNDETCVFYIESFPRKNTLKFVFWHFHNFELLLRNTHGIRRLLIGLLTLKWSEKMKTIF